jgi:hypothetical protein
VFVFFELANAFKVLFEVLLEAFFGKEDLLIVLYFPLFSRSLRQWPDWYFVSWQCSPVLPLVSWFFWACCRCMPFSLAVEA